MCSAAASPTAGSVVPAVPRTDRVGGRHDVGVSPSRASTHERGRDVEDFARAQPDEDAPGTGDDAVDAALTRLAGLDELPVREHVAVFDAVHGALADRLSEQAG